MKVNKGYENLKASTFRVEGGATPLAMNSYQDLQFASKGQFARSSVKMMASGGDGDGEGPRGGPEFFKFKATKITGEEIPQL